MLRFLPGSVLLLTAPLLAAAADPPVVASCPDGSVILAKKWKDVRCAGSERATPGADPRAGSLLARRVAMARQSEGEREKDLEAQLADSLARTRDASRVPPAVVVLTARERAELEGLVARGRTPAATSLHYERGAEPQARMRLAHSSGFDRRLRRAFAGSGSRLQGPVLVFQLHAAEAASLPPAPAFAQRGVTFHPDPRDPRQLGWLAGPGAPRLGYVVLPAGFDVRRPLAVLWGDAVVATRPWPGG